VTTTRDDLPDDIAALQAVLITAAGNGQLSPAAASRIRVSRTVDGATPTRRAISLPETPAALNRSTSRAWRIAILSAGIVPSAAKPKERTLSGPAETQSQGPYPDDIIPERWAKSSRNVERHQIGMHEGSTRSREADGGARSWGTSLKPD
jgi:hypothetical protein